MAGERIMEALELADAEREVFAAYEDAKAKLPAHEAERLQPPPRNTVLAAYDKEPDQYVLMVIEKIHGSALMDALLVLPFRKVLSLMVYLNEWARKVRRLHFDAGECSCVERHLGSERRTGVTYYDFSPENPSSSNSRAPLSAFIANTTAKALAGRTTKAEGNARI